MRKTTRNVTIVVPVLMISCQVSEKWKYGPSTAQAMMTATARKNVYGRPTTWAVWLAKRPNHSLTELARETCFRASRNGFWCDGRGVCDGDDMQTTLNLIRCGNCCRVRFIKRRGLTRIIDCESGNYAKCRSSSPATSRTSRGARAGVS